MSNASICLYSSVSDPDQSQASSAFPWWFNQYTWKPSHWPLLMKQNSVAELINCLPFPSFNHLTLSHLIVKSWAPRINSWALRLPLLVTVSPLTSLRKPNSAAHVLPWWITDISSIWFTSQHENHNCCLPTDTMPHNCGNSLLSRSFWSYY